MPRYFLELSYKGTNYSGFQLQENAKTIQSSVELALETLYRQPLPLTGASRTDSGVHALQNFFHFDTPITLQHKHIYNLNAILPPDINIKAFYRVADDAHSRFGAISREYDYYIYHSKDPFLQDRAWYYPFTVNINLLHEAAEMVLHHHHFIAFSKRNTQVNNFNCTISRSQWRQHNNGIVYNVVGNRFLRGMVRALVSSMLRVARGHLSLQQFGHLLSDGTQASADFSAPPHGLFLTHVNYPQGYLIKVD